MSSWSHKSQGLQRQSYTTMKRSRNLQYYRKRRKTQRAGQRFRQGSKILPWQRGFLRSAGQLTTRFSGSGGTEWKYLDTAINQPIDFTAETFPASGLQVIVAGNGENNRIGRKVTVKSIQFRGTFLAVPSTSANFSAVIHLYLIQDTQTNGALAGFTDVFTGAQANTAMYNLDNSKRFRILKKWVCDFNATAGATTAYNNQSKHIEFYKRCNIPINYSSTTGAISEVASNGLFLAAGVTPNGADDDITLEGTVRIRFVDY